MLYQVFDTQAEAQAYADAEAAHLPRRAGDITTIWDIPKQIANGSWIVSCVDGDGVEWQEEWNSAGSQQSPA